jgi:DMSO/TMAO reductase YedYZ molybdopterin-dependent catalytic subunit
MKETTIIKSPDTERKNRVPPNQRLTDQFPILHYGDVPHINMNEWVFTISGLVDKERKIRYQEFMALPRVKVFSDIHCVTGWSRLDNLWEGVSTAVIKDLAKILPAAKFVMVHGAGGFTTNLSLKDFSEPDVLFAMKHNEAPLSREHGHPVRLVVPRLYFWKSAKWATGLEFMAEDKPGFWETGGYHNHGDPWTEERYSD